MGLISDNAAAYLIHPLSFVFFPLFEADPWWIRNCSIAPDYLPSRVDFEHSLQSTLFVKLESNHDRKRYLWLYKFGVRCFFCGLNLLAHHLRHVAGSSTLVERLLARSTLRFKACVIHVCRFKIYRHLSNT